MDRKIVINGTTYTEPANSTFKAVHLIEEFIKNFVTEGKVTEEKPVKK